MAEGWTPPPADWLRWAIDHAMHVLGAILGWCLWVEHRIRQLRKVPERMDAIEKEQADSAIERAEMRVMLREIRDRTARMDDTLHATLLRRHHIQE